MFAGSDYETLLQKLAAIGVWPHRDDINKHAFVVWHDLPDELVIKAESFYRDDLGSLDREPEAQHQSRSEQRSKHQNGLQ